jgi:hypothetical protein
MLPFVVLTHLESLYADLALTVTLLFGKFNSCFWLHKNSINSFMSHVIFVLLYFTVLRQHWEPLLSCLLTCCGCQINWRV